LLQNEITMKPLHHFIPGLVLFAIVTATFPARAEHNLELEVVTIQGNRELPKVLYIVPWKRLKNDSQTQKLVLHSLFEDAFDPLDPDAFKKHVENTQAQIRP